MPDDPPPVPRSPKRFVVGCSGVLALGFIAAVLVAIVVPMRANPGRARQSEARLQLGALYTGERAYFAERDRFDEDLHKVGFLPPRGNRYAYWSGLGGKTFERGDNESERLSVGGFKCLGRDGATTPATPGEVGCPITVAIQKDGKAAGIGVSGTGEDQIFVGYAAANLDADATWDCWSVASVARTTSDGRVIPSGVPFNELSDVEN